MAIEWQDTAILLSAKRHGENDVLVSLMTSEHGRHAGLVKGGASKRNQGLYQPGNQLRVVWKARLEAHLGSVQAELEKARPAIIFSDVGRLAALNAACSLVDKALPERDPWQAIHDDLATFLEMLLVDEAAPMWAYKYVLWELSLLTDLGFGLDLSVCAATGETENLIYVSPKSARAVSQSAGAPYHHKLLPLPAFLIESQKNISAAAILEGMQLTGYFLLRYVTEQKKLPAARHRFQEWLEKQV